MMNRNQQDAVMDCRYALSLSQTALHQHLNTWLESLDEMSEDDKEYCLTLAEIKAKLGTNKCLLKEI